VDHIDLKDQVLEHLEIQLKVIINLLSGLTVQIIVRNYLRSLEKGIQEVQLDNK
jgi:hypothetical protein